MWVDHQRVTENGEDDSYGDERRPVADEPMPGAGNEDHGGLPLYGPIYHDWLGPRYWSIVVLDPDIDGSDRSSSAESTSSTSEQSGVG